MNEVQEFKLPAPRRTPPRWVWVLAIGLPVGALVVLGLWSWFTLNVAYAEGDRAGVLHKFSRDGWLCKTYEGELAMYIADGVAPQIWQFSTRDERLAQELAKSVGQEVRIQYAEHRGVPGNCFGQTRYFAKGFTLVAGRLR